MNENKNIVTQVELDVVNMWEKRLDSFLDSAPISSIEREYYQNGLKINMSLIQKMVSAQNAEHTDQ